MMSKFVVHARARRYKVNSTPSHQGPPLVTVQFYRGIFYYRRRMSSTSAIQFHIASPCPLEDKDVITISAHGTSATGAHSTLNLHLQQFLISSWDYVSYSINTFTNVIAGFSIITPAEDSSWFLKALVPTRRVKETNQFSYLWDHLDLENNSKARAQINNKKVPDIWKLKIKFLRYRFLSKWITVPR